MKTLRRRIQTVSNTLGIRRTKIKSLSRDDGTEWNQSVDTVTGIKRCDCPGFTYRGTCKHLARAVAACERDGQTVTGCCKCHGETGLYPLADERGEEIKGVKICRRCITLAASGRVP